jgi:twinkle protein
MAETAVIRHGCRIVQVDPWNRMEASREPRETIERCLRVIDQFATDLNCHVQIIAHPAKMEGHRKGQAPLLEDIAGAKHWGQHARPGLHRAPAKRLQRWPNRTEAVILHRKTRFEELGYPCKLNLDYDRNKGRYKSVDYDIQ